MSRLNWLDSYYALIVPFAASAFGTFLIRQSFLQVPSDLVDAAIMDGASHLGILRNVMLPLSQPALLTFALLSFNGRWNDYFWPLTMTNSTVMRTLPVGIVAMRAGAEGGTNWHILMAGTVIVLLPILVLFMLAQRYFVAGIAYSGLKGV
jgi:ABC-type glycerol-3-phosphate transport system permease component